MRLGTGKAFHEAKASIRGGNVAIKDGGGAQHGPSGGRWDRELPSGEAKTDKGKRMLVQESRWQVPPNLGFSLQKHRGRKKGCNKRHQC